MVTQASEVDAKMQAAIYLPHLGDSMTPHSFGLDLMALDSNSSTHDDLPNFIHHLWWFEVLVLHPELG